MRLRGAKEAIFRANPHVWVQTETNAGKNLSGENQIGSPAADGWIRGRRKIFCVKNCYRTAHAAAEIRNDVTASQWQGSDDIGQNRHFVKVCVIERKEIDAVHSRAPKTHF